MKQLLSFIVVLLLGSVALAQAKIMNPGETHGQLVYLSKDDVLNESDKYKSLSPISIPVFAEMPFNMSVVAGAITLLEQSLLSHVQIKARARGIPNLDISALEGGMDNPIFSGFGDGDFIHMVLTKDGEIKISASTEEQANAFYKEKKNQAQKVNLSADLEFNALPMMEELGWQDFVKVGSKAANYAELAHALNTPERTVVRPSMAVPFYYYDQFVESNPDLKRAIERVVRDPLMKRVTATRYREEKLQAIREMILSDETVIDPDFLDAFMAELDTFVDPSGKLMKVKLRSSTNAEDLPNFNGAGLYTSESYKPLKNGVEKSKRKKLKSLEEAIRVVWSSVWNLRAYEEREAFSIPHDQVYMGIQVNPSFGDEEVDGVLVTMNLAEREDLQGAGVYIEAQRGDKHSVANPTPGVRSEKILVLYDEARPLDTTAYTVHILAKSNIADDKETILDGDNPSPIMSDDEIKDLVYQSLRAVEHFNPIFSEDGGKTTVLDIEFKVDDDDTNRRQVYLKQARPFIE